MFIISTPSITKAVTDLLARGDKPENIAFTFHKQLSHLSTSICQRLQKETKIKDVALSGGVFQNRLLLQMLVSDLKEKGFNVLLPATVPFNDGCIALGQIAVAKAGLG
jgi:hydrogenase maturation protein HypF